MITPLFHITYTHIILESAQANLLTILLNTTFITDIFLFLQAYKAGSNPPKNANFLVECDLMIYQRKIYGYSLTKKWELPYVDPKKLLFRLCGCPHFNCLGNRGFQMKVKRLTAPLYIIS